MSDKQIIALWLKAHEMPLPFARMVLEEAAKACEDKLDLIEVARGPRFTRTTELYNAVIRRCAASIRALKEKA